MNELTQAFSESVRNGSFIRLVLSRPIRTREAAVDKVTVRPVELASGMWLQFTEHQSSRETHRNLDVDNAVSEVERLFGAVFRNTHLFTADVDITAKMKGGAVRIRRAKPTRQLADTLHNRTPRYVIPDGTPCPFLIETGVMADSGKVRSSRQDKFRQINRFLEFVEDVIPSLPAEGAIRVVDFGCGKSYLTFALHHLLTNVHQREVDITGLDLKDDVVSDCNAITARLGCKGLRFRTGDIADHLEREPVHLSVSLHACDTASDVALAKAVEWQAGVILCVPCCQHEFAPQISTGLLPSVQRHGILRERFAAITTDALRALALEICNYRTQVVEFIDMEHTAKNLLIRAVRRKQPDPHLAARMQEYVELKQQLGLGTLAIETALGKPFIPTLGLHDDV